ncbi:MAG TPA: class I SAM-dependent methyltransferase [Stellaceae bacterium]
MGETPSYDAQHRGGRAAYETYFAGMDRTMAQKLAFVGAHLLLDPGSRVADMGCGSGAGTHQLALLNPQIRVIGVDINPESISLAREKFVLPNLAFVVGDAAQPIFAEAPLDGILSSSTLHHVYTFNGYSRDAVRRALASHLQCLREDGIFVLRDFVAPALDAYVLLELGDGPSRGETPAELGDADLLRRFARTARPLDTRAGPGFFLEEVAPQRPATRLFRLPHKWAVEFVLRKDYRRDWDVELLEEYTYFSANEFAAELARAGARLLCAEPYWNPWIVRHRFAGKFRLLHENGAELGWPPTNFVAVAQRVKAGSSVQLVERRPADHPPTFLALETMAGNDSDAPAYDLVRRPSPVADLLPWRIADGRLRVVARHGYPRPITRAVPRGPALLEGSRWGGYLIEPVTGMVPCDAGIETVAAKLMERAGIAADAVANVATGLRYYPSPGGIDEVVQSLFVQLAGAVAEGILPAALSGFSTAGRVRELDAQGLLRAAHVGMLPEARIEINVYALMDRLGIRPEPFIGEPVDIAEAPLPAGIHRVGLRDLLAQPALQPFTRRDASAGYLRLVRSVFADQAEEDGLPRTLAEQELEFVLPRERSINTVVALPVLHHGEPLVGLETRLLPAPQIHDGNARVITAPAWRLGRDIATLEQARAWIAARIGIAVADVIPLGAAYFPSAGITPERVYPFVARVAGAAGKLPYDFVPLRELRQLIGELRDGHLLVAALRLLHAMGLWNEPPNGA